MNDKHIFLSFLTCVSLVVMSISSAADSLFEKAACIYGTTYTSKRIDLDGDGDLDGVVIHHGEGQGGTGGFNLRIFRNNPDVFELIGCVKTAAPPIYIRKSKAKGMHDLIIYRKGLARVNDKLGYGHMEVVRFEGKRYKPAGTEKNGTVEILKTDQKILGKFNSR